MRASVRRFAPRAHPPFDAPLAQQGGKHQGPASPKKRRGDVSKVPYMSFVKRKYILRHASWRSYEPSSSPFIYSPTAAHWTRSPQFAASRGCNRKLAPKCAAAVMMMRCPLAASRLYHRYWGPGCTCSSQTKINKQNSPDRNSLRRPEAIPILIGNRPTAATRIPF